VTSPPAGKGLRQRFLELRRREMIQKCNKSGCRRFFWCAYIDAQNISNVKTTHLIYPPAEIIFISPMATCLNLIHREARCLINYPYFLCTQLSSRKELRWEKMGIRVIVRPFAADASSLAFYSLYFPVCTNCLHLQTECISTRFFCLVKR